MKGEFNCKVSSKNSTQLLKNLQNTTGGYFLATPCMYELMMNCFCQYFDAVGWVVEKASGL